MKTKLRQTHLSLLICLFAAKAYAQVGVNILNPHPSSAMQIQSPAGTFKGLLTPSMTTTERMNVPSGTITPADGLVVYDVNHKMHYAFNSASRRWISLSPLTLSTPSVGSTSFPSGVITTPSTSVPTTFSLGINKQNPSQALDVAGNATVSGNISNGGNVNTVGNSTVNGNSSVSGSLSVAGFPNNALVPAGVIVMWSGTLVPVGWAVCDGGTYNGLLIPDLRGRFIVGMTNSQGAQAIPSGQYLAIGVTGLTPTSAPNDGSTINYGTIGNTGGEIGHTLSMAEMPSHTHNVSVSISNSNVLGFNGSSSTNLGSGSYSSGDPQTVSATVTESSRGSNQIHENRPPYYVLAYIIKLP